MDIDNYKEIVSILNKNGRPDLVHSLKDFFISLGMIKADSSTDNESSEEIYSEEEEEEPCITGEDINYKIDGEGFYSLN